MTTKRTKRWLVPALLLLLGSLNILFGALQLDTIWQGPPAVPDEAVSMTYFQSPIPIVSHIVAGILFNLLGPLQFAPLNWQRWPRWHRWSGRLLMIAGVVVGFSGLWMNQFFPAYGGFLKYSAVALSSIGIVVALGLALRAILARDVPRHRVWMMRAFALGLGPATQRLIILPIFFTTGIPDDLTIGVIVWSGFLINLTVVEWVWRRDRRSGTSIANMPQVDVTHESAVAR